MVAANNGSKGRYKMKQWIATTVDADAEAYKAANKRKPQKVFALMVNWMTFR